MKAIIMAGGEGTRLRPITCNTPKAMMPIMDKPIMEYAVELLKQNGIIDIGVTVQYLPDEIIHYFGDGKEFGVNLKYFVEDNPLGTAGSVKNAEEFLKDTFIVISGDALTDINLCDAIKYHKEKKAIATLVLKEVTVPLQYGVVAVNKEGRITDFLEKPSWSEVFSDKVNTGIYILEPEIFKYFDKNQKFDFSSELFPILLKENEPMYGYATECYWCDIGDIDQYKQCHYDILRGKVKINFNAKQLGDGIWIGENCDISSKANISTPVYIGSGSKIYDGASIGSYTVLGKNNIISSNTDIKRSVLFQNCYIGSSAEIRGTILCKKVQIESKVSIFEESVVGSDCLVKEKTIIKPNVKIWPDKVIESSSIVKSNIIWGGKFSKSIFGKVGITGEVNVDITPEFVSKIGSAYGSILKSGSKVAISCSEHRAAEMLKYSLAIGLLSMGIEVYDLKKVPSSVMRQSTLFLGVQGSAYIFMDDDKSQKVSIIFMDSNGLNIDKRMERKIENSFIREEFRRVRADSCKQITYITDAIGYYIRQIINELDVKKIKDQKYKVILGSNNNIIMAIFQRIFDELGIDVKLCEEFNDIIRFKKVVIESKADMGINITSEEQKALIIDENGNLIKDDKYDALNALVMLKSTVLKTLVAPVTASCSIEKIAKKYGVKFIRTKTSQKCVLEEYLKNETTLNEKDVIFNYLISLDVINICILTLNVMAKSKISLSTLMKEIPEYYNVKQEVICPWNMKGRVMRNLIEENNSKCIELIEGVKVSFDDSWVLVLPDADEPLCRVYTESKDYSEAERIKNEFLKKIELIAAIDEV